MIKRLTTWHPRPGVDRDDAVHLWTTSHVALVRAIPGVRRYEQNRCRPGPEGDEPPYAGLGELWFDDLESAALALTTPEWQAVIADAARFMDMSRVVAAWADQPLG